MGSCQNYGPFLGTLNIRCRIIIRTPKGTIILTTQYPAGHRAQASSDDAREELPWRDFGCMA